MGHTTYVPESSTISELAQQITEQSEHIQGSDPVNTLLSMLGSRFQCDRVFICERRKNGSFDNTYEWCAEDVISEKDLFQNSPSSTYAVWYARFEKERSVIVQDVEDLKEEDLNLYYLLSRQKIHTVVVDQIRFHGIDFGLIGIDNPSPDEIEHIKDVLTTLRPYLSSLLESRNMKRMMTESGYLDRLTGAGNRLSLNDLLERLPKGEALGLFAVDVINLKKINDLQGHHAGDELLQRMTELLNQSFGPNYVFRIDGDEFLALYLEPQEDGLVERNRELMNALNAEGISAACSYCYENPWVTDFDTLLRRLDLSLYEEKRSLLRHNDQETKVSKDHYRKTLLLLDLVSETVAPLFQPKEDGHDPHPIHLSDVCESHAAKIHPEDQSLYRSFWDKEKIRSQFHRKPQSSPAIVYRVKRGEEWIWTEESMELLEEGSDGFRVLVTVRMDQAMRPFHPIHDAVIEEASHARASVTMYRNREFFHRAASWMSQTDAAKLAMIAVDINHFKLYNNMFGRKAGNRMLEMIQDTLLRLSRDYHGISGYMGNDNFAMLLPMYQISMEEAVRRMEQQLREFRIPTLFMPCAGVYICEDFSELPSEQYEFASLALDEVSGDLNTHVSIFNRERYDRRKEEQFLLLDIEDGLAKEEFTFFLQPKVNMKTGHLISFEALVRWNRSGEIISPARFVEPMEKANIIHKLDMLVLHQVCAWLKDRIDHNLPVIPVSVNLSRADFDYGDVARQVSDTVRSSNIPPHLLQIEITESAFYEDDGEISRSVAFLQEHGHKILLDDFGKGFSSLNSLHSMNFDVLKLDKQFIDALNKEEDRRIVESVIRMAHMIGLLVVAEGVETPEQAELLMKLNCHYCQGYYFYRPLPKEEAEVLIHDASLIQEAPPFISGMRFGRLSFAELIDEGLLTPAQINDITGPIAIFEITPDSIHILQMNDKYAAILSESTERLNDGYNFMDQLDDSEQNVRENFLKADESPGYKSSAAFHKADGTTSLLEATIYPISRTDQARFYFISLREVEILG